MADFSSYTYVKPDEALQLATIIKDGAGNLSAIKARILEWVSQNVLGLSATDRAVAHYTDEDHGLEIINHRDNGNLFFAIRFSRPAMGSQNLDRRANTEIVIRDSHGNLAVTVKKSYQRRRKVSPTTSHIIGPTISRDIKDVLPLIFDGRTLASSPEHLTTADAVSRVAWLVHGMDWQVKSGDPLKTNKRVQRQLPVILAVEPDNVSDDWNQSIARVADKAYGFAHVFVIPKQYLDNFNSKFGGTWRLKPGDVRCHGIEFNNLHSTLDQHPRLLSHSQDAENDFIERVFKSSLSNPVMANDNMPGFDDLKRIVLDNDISQSQDGAPDAQVRLLRQKNRCSGSGS